MTLMGIVLVEGGAKIGSKRVQEKRGFQQFFKEICRKRVEKGTVAGKRREAMRLFVVFILRWTLLQHLCILMGIGSSLNHDSQFGVMEDKDCLVYPSTCEFFIYFQALYNSASPWLSRLIFGLPCRKPAPQLPEHSPSFACPRPANPFSHLCLHKPSHPLSHVV